MFDTCLDAHFLSVTWRVCRSNDRAATYPYDCTKYYDCESNSVNPTLTQCGEGYVFSYQYQSCLSPALVPCAGIDGDGAPPIDTTLTLVFKELELITKEAAAKGF